MMYIRLLMVCAVTVVHTDVSSALVRLRSTQQGVASGRPVFVNEVGVDGDGARTRSSSAAADTESRDPDQLQLSISFDGVENGDELRLNLTRTGRTEQDDNLAPIIVAAGGKKTIWTPPPNETFAIYQDRDHNAAILRRSSTNSDGSEQHDYQGTFRHGLQDYTLQLTDGIKSRRRRRRDADSDPPSDYVIFPAVGYGRDILIDDPDAVNQQRSPFADEWARYMKMTAAAAGARSNKAAVDPKHYTVDVLMVVDYAIYSSWYEASAERTSQTKSDDAINGIRYYYWQIANGMDLRYGSITDYTDQFTVNIRLAGVYIATTEYDSPWTEGPGIKTVVGSDVYTNANAGLRYFEWWIGNVTASKSIQLPTFDQATLFTGNLLNSLKNGAIVQIAGLGNIGVICSSRSVTINQEWDEYASTGTATHELGHNLGAQHDGLNNTCNSTWQYIMATAPGALNDDNFLHPFKFSSCSVDYMNLFLAQLTQQQVNCLSTPAQTDPGVVDWMLGIPPGQFIPIDKQCQLIYGPTSFYCGGALNDAFMCRQMFCYDATAKQCQTRTEQRAANGTTCGNNAWCLLGSCVNDPNAPTALDYCLSGDWMGPLTDANGQSTTCAATTLSNPEQCYTDDFNKRCCDSCSKIGRLNSASCPYGDRNPSYCRNTITLKDCRENKTRESCCSTCDTMLYGIKGCEYGDSASWCPTIHSSQCYTANFNSTTCCFTCWLRTADGYPGCEYGDKAQWCETEPTTRCRNQATNDSCCLLCHPELAPAGSGSNSCQNSDNWCTTISSSFCYAVDKKCCKSCKAYHTRITGCEYGDRFGWCASYVTIDNKDELCKKGSTYLDDCCYSCYKLLGVTRPPTLAPKSTAAPLMTSPTSYVIMVMFSPIIVLLRDVIARRRYETIVQI